MMIMMMMDINMTTTYGRHCSGTNGPRGHILIPRENPLSLLDRRTWYSLRFRCCKQLRLFFSYEDLFQNVSQTKPSGLSLGQVSLPEMIFLISDKNMEDEIQHYTYISFIYKLLILVVLQIEAIQAEMALQC